MNTAPLGLFITWTVYGTFLPGDNRGWRHRTEGNNLSKPQLEEWHRERLSHDVILLDTEMRNVAEHAINEIGKFRGWTIWAVSVRSNHAHVVVTATDYNPKLVRDQLKAKATRNLRQSYEIWKDRPVWSTK